MVALQKRSIAVNVHINLSRPCNYILAGHSHTSEKVNGERKILCFKLLKSHFKVDMSYNKFANFAHCNWIN